MMLLMLKLITTIANR